MEGVVNNNEDRSKSEETAILGRRLSLTPGQRAMAMKMGIKVGSAHAMVIFQEMKKGDELDVAKLTIWDDFCNRFGFGTGIDFLGDNDDEDQAMVLGEVIPVPGDVDFIADRPVTLIFQYVKRGERIKFENLPCWRDMMSSMSPPRFLGLDNDDDDEVVPDDPPSWSDNNLSIYFTPDPKHSLEEVFSQAVDIAKKKGQDVYFHFKKNDFYHVTRESTMESLMNDMHTKAFIRSLE